MKKLSYAAIILCYQWLFALQLFAQVDSETLQRQELEAIDDQVQSLKSEVIQINHELSLLEEKLLFPSTTQVAIFLSLKSELELDSVTAKLDNIEVSNHVYTFREIEALQKGGVQRIYTGNVAGGNHQLVIQISGRAGSSGVKQSADFTFKKEIGPKFVEIQLTGSARQPTVNFKDW